MSLELVQTTVLTVTTALDIAANGAITVPAGSALWRPTGLRAHWETSAQAGNRVIAFTVTDENANIVYEVICNVNLAASLACNYILREGLTPSAAFISVGTARYGYFPMPTTMLLPGWTVTPSDTAAIDAATDVVSMYLVVDQYETQQR